MATLLIFCLAFVAIGIFIMLPDPNTSRTTSWFAVCFFGFCAVTFSVLLVRPQRLELNLAGFTLSGGLTSGEKLTMWHDVAGFFVRDLPKGGQMVGFNYAPHARPDNWMVKLNGKLGAEGGLPKGFGPSPKELAEELNSWHQRATGRAYASNQI